MSGHAGRRIGIGGRGERQMNAQQCLESPIGLTLDIDNGDDWPLDAATIGGDSFTHMVGERPSLFEPELAVLCPRKAIPRVRHEREQSHPLVSPRSIADE